jgi:hypothetical protein
MGMRRCFVLLPALLLAVAAFPSHAAAAKRCALKNSKTVAQNDRVRVFTRRINDDDIRWYGCLFSRNRRFVLTDVWPGWAEVVDSDVAGRFVALVEFTSNSHYLYDHVRRFDLRTGASTTLGCSGGDYDDPNPRSEISHVVVTGRGAVAWEQHVPQQGSDPRYVVAYDTRGRRIVDPGPLVDPGSLAVDSGVLTWRNAEEQRSDPLGSGVPSRKRRCSPRTSVASA